MLVLVTGSSGALGRTVVAGLDGRGDEVRGFDLVAPDDDLARHLRGGSTVGDLLDPDALGAAVDGVDAVVHLAGNPSETNLPDALVSHAHTTAAVLQAMVDAGVDRIVYASSNHAVGMTPHGARLSEAVQPRPDSFYGVGKVAAEGLLSLYADTYGLRAVALRIGSFLERPTTRRALETWLSPGDAVRLVVAALTTDVPGFTAVYGVSANARSWWDVRTARAIGYQPLDDAEAYLDQIPARTEDTAEAQRVGGPFAVEPLGRPFS